MQQNKIAAFLIKLACLFATRDREGWESMTRPLDSWTDKRNEETRRWCEEHPDLFNKPHGRQATNRKVAD